MKARMRMKRSDAHGDAAIQIPAALQEAWLKRLRWHYDLYNQHYLGEQLAAPLIRLSDSETQLGQWNPRTRTITISQFHILWHPWEAVLDTLRHEMAHQYVDEALDLSNAPPHGKPFARASKLLRCEASRGPEPGQLGNINDSADERDKILRRIKEILALAASPNENEAANAMRMANRYLLKYNLDLAELDEARLYSTRHLGKCAARIQEFEYTLAGILQDHFFVSVIWTFSYAPLTDQPGRILEISGTHENLEIATYVYHYVMNLTEPLWKEYRRSRPEGRCTKLQYLAGLLRGFQDKLDKHKEELREEHGLIWLGDPELEEYYRYVHPRVRSVATGGVSRNKGFADGFAEGQKINIRRGLKGGAKNRGRRISGP